MWEEKSESQGERARKPHLLYLTGHTEIKMRNYLFGSLNITEKRLEFFFFLVFDYLLRPRHFHNYNKRKGYAIITALANQRGKTCPWMGGCVGCIKSEKNYLM